MSMVAPVKWRAASEQRNTAKAASSPGGTISPRGISAVTAAMAASSRLSHTMSVPANPGEMAKASTPSLTEGFDPEESVQLIERERCTMLHGFDVHYAGLMDARERLGADISSLRVGSIPAGMDSTLPTVKRVVEEFCPVVSAYGLTEGWACGAIGFLDGSVEQRCETSGFPMPGYEFKVIDPETGEQVPNGEPGEILQSGYLVMHGYYREPELTQATIRDGWLHTGDMGIMRDDGYFRFVGRYKDMLKVGGENVSPMEVEGFLLDCMPLELVAIVGCPDERLGEVPVAFVLAHADFQGDLDTLEQQVLDVVCRQDRKLQDPAPRLRR